MHYSLVLARGRPIIVEWERDARHSAGLSRSVTHRYVTERYTFHKHQAAQWCGPRSDAVRLSLAGPWRRRGHRHYENSVCRSRDAVGGRAARTRTSNAIRPLINRQNREEGFI
ncbi:hypothetical protein EVAR_58805_1 [Eumeta japonica]|uniref:Uncharacterized protein n=1 Tax=Eumeta variegata TaxID=151549 RepID=A0A4C1YKK4_EUMVA|nr:hypothetical protein EVAR_58805_1 [Eumeta japonica]